MSRGFLPRQDVQFIGPTGRPTVAFYTWLQGLDSALKGGASVAEIQREIDRLRQTIADIPTSGFLPDTATVRGEGSIYTTGTLAGGIVLAQLEGDQAAPAPSHYYGTNDAGLRGFHQLPEPDASGYLPLTTGEISGDQPVFVYGPDGRLIYAPVT